MNYKADAAETRKVKGRSTTFAYRDLGSENGGTPLVLAHRFRATIDHWDPKFLDLISAKRRVIIFDNTGVGESDGAVPGTIAEMADDLVDFVRTLGLEKVDLGGWSMGGFIVQLVALKYPELVHSLIVLGSGPGEVPNTPPMDPRVLEAMTAPEPGDDVYLFLFFGDDEASRKLGLDSLRRLDTRLNVSQAKVSDHGWGQQLQALVHYNSPGNSAWTKLEDIKVPFLIANGAHDIMVPSEGTFATVKRVRNAEAILYGDSGHAFLFQHPETFASALINFLERADGLGRPMS